MSERAISRRRMFMLSGAALGGAVVLPSVTTPVALGAPGAASEISERLSVARSDLQEGQQRLAQDVEGGELWVQKYGGVVTTQLVVAGDQPLPPSSATEIWSSGAPEGAEESMVLDQGAVAPAASSCTLATATASILTALGGTAIAALAIANPAGVVLGGVFFSASMLNYAAIIAGSYSATVGWLGAILC